MKNDRIKSHIFLILYLVGNGILTGELVNFMRVIGTRDHAIKDVAPELLFVLGAWGLSAYRAIHHYNKLYNNKQK